MLKRQNKKEAGNGQLKKVNREKWIFSYFYHVIGKFPKHGNNGVYLSF